MLKHIIFLNTVMVNNTGAAEITWRMYVQMQILQSVNLTLIPRGITLICKLCFLLPDPCSSAAGFSGEH